MFKPYLFQSTALFIALSIAFMAGSIASNEAIIVAALGPTSFILFITPRSPSASARHTLGGHALGILVGSLAAITSEGQMAQSFISTSVIERPKIGLIFDFKFSILFCLSKEVLFSDNSCAFTTKCK